MKRKSKQAAAGMLAGVCLLGAGAFYPAQPCAGWWCSAFSVMCEQAVEEQPDAGDTGIVFRWKLIEWWKGLTR